MWMEMDAQRMKCDDGIPILNWRNHLEQFKAYGPHLITLTTWALSIASYPPSVYPSLPYAFAFLFPSEFKP